jgi:uncharacterized protein HemX
MARSTKKAPPRKPVKARGALPTPRVAPKRVRRKWYQFREAQIFGAILVLVLIGVGLKIFSDVRKEAKAHDQKVTAVKRFTNKVQLAQTGMQDIFSAINQAPQDLKDGKMTPEDFKKQTDVWLEKLRGLDTKLRQPVPATPSQLQEAQAQFVDGTLVYIDAVKSYALAASLTDTTLRDNAIQQGNNLITHGTSIYGLAQRTIEKLRLSLGITKKSSTTNNPLTGPIQLPSEEAPPPQPQVPQGAQGVVPSVPGGATSP